MPCGPERGAARHFASRYADARATFRSACRRRGLEVASHRHRLSGPDDSDLTTDVALVGSPRADNLVILISGTHGAEGLAGSGCQVSWLAGPGPEALRDDVAVLLVHMLNPWGAAWGRRQTEDNVDLNRNFLDFEAPLPANVHYEQLKAALDCPSFRRPDHDEAQALIRHYCATAGADALAAAIFQGQYTDPLGVGFGGDAPTWSNVVLQQILSDHASKAGAVAVIDFHTGFGPYGYGMPINSSADGSPAMKSAQSWYGPSLLAMRAPGSRLPYSFSGDLCGAVERLLAPAMVVPIALEFGTYDVAQLLQVQIDDAWSYRRADQQPEAVAVTRRQVRDFFYPATDDWCEMLAFRSHQVIAQAVRGLTDGT